MRVLLGDARGNADVLGISTVVEQQIVTEIRLAALTEPACAARRGVRSHHALSQQRTFHHIACYFMTEESRRHDHLGVIAAAEYFDIGAAGKCRAHTDQHVARLKRGYGHPLHFDMLLAMEHGSGHHLLHSTITLSESPVGCVAR